MLFRKVFVSLLLIWAMAATYAAEGAVATPAPVETVRQVIKAAALDRMLLMAVRQELEQNNRKAPDRTVDPDIYMASMTSDAVADRLAAAYAPYLSAEYGICYAHRQAVDPFRFA